MYANDQLFLFAGELIALYGADFDLLVENRAADFQRTEVFREQNKVQARCTQIQRRCLGPGYKLPLWRRTLVARPHSDVVAFDQRFEAGNPRQGNRRLDHPELGAFDQVILGQWVHRQLGGCARQIRIDLQRFQAAHLNTLVHHRCATGLQAVEITELDLHPDTGGGGVKVFIESERQARIGRRTVLAVFGCGERNTTGDDAGQGLTADLHTRQIGVDADAAGIPETCVFAHQFGVSRLDEDLELDGALVLGQHIAFDLPHFDLFVKHRTATVQRAQAVGLDSQVQTGLGIGERRFLGQGLELADRLAFPRADGDIVT
ncbi:hypothetical protein D3C76_652340 [compost metagenome]